MEYYLDTKNGVFIVKWIELDILLSDLKQTQEYKYHIFSHR